ncbi:calcyclin-binding protein [Colletes gigas]|uniref:calcyclin-binding protein n=1 Tax=Colletes gigas TaxID=935657 RepID=UPI001C9AA683|nr:calcyclin-binding protein [Colletes gigas]
MSTKVDNLRLDIEELESLLQQAVRQKTKDTLSLEVRKLQTELTRLIEETKTTTATSTNATPSSSDNKCYEVKINNYCWDETNTTMKLYVTLENVQQLPKEAVTCNFSERSVNLNVFGLNNKNYNLTINNLCEEIDVNNSNVKVKTDMVVVFLAKKVAKTWSHVTEVEKRMMKAKTSTVPEIGTDPNASIMNIMRKIYNEGDDEMKKIIAKAWTESEEKMVATGSL